MAKDRRDEGAWSPTHNPRLRAAAWAFTLIAVPALAAFTPVDKGFLVGVVVTAACATALLGRSTRRVPTPRSSTNEVRLYSVLAATADAHLAVDDAGTIGTWDDRAAELFGWKATEAIGQPFLSTFVNARTVDGSVRRLLDFWKSESPVDSYVIDVQARRADNVEIPVRITAWHDDRATANRVHFFVQDLTRRFENEEHVAMVLAEKQANLLQIQELERAKSEFTSSVSHEFRSPLTSTLGYLELLADGDAGPLDADQGRMVEIAARNARRLQNLIEDMLVLSRIENGTYSVRFRPIDVRALLASCVNHVSVAANARNLTISIEAEDNLGLSPADEPQLARALNNVLDNAVKFTPPDGAITISVKRAVDHVIIDITDTGIGIPAEEQRRLFERFFRASVAVENAFHGTGLGLTIAKSIIEHHGGTVSVASVLSKGTTVTMVLPALSTDDAPGSSFDYSADHNSTTAYAKVPMDVTANATVDYDVGDSELVSYEATMAPGPVITKEVVASEAVNSQAVNALVSERVQS